MVTTVSDSASKQPLPEWLATLPPYLSRVLHTETARKFHDSILKALDPAKCKGYQRRFLNQSAGQLVRNTPNFFANYLSEVNSLKDGSVEAKKAFDSLTSKQLLMLQALASGSTTMELFKTSPGRPKGTGYKFTPYEDAALACVYLMEEEKLKKSEAISLLIVLLDKQSPNAALDRNQLMRATRRWEGLTMDEQTKAHYKKRIDVLRDH